MSVVIVACFALSLACWGLTARTARAGWIVAIVLAACVAAETGLAENSVLPGKRVTLLVGFVLATVGVIITGIIVEARRAGTHWLRSSGARGIAGLVLSVLYCGFSLVIVLLIILEVAVNGGPVSTPSSTEVLPLPARLAISGNYDQGCGSGSQTFCSREILVRSTTGLSADGVTQRLRDHLDHTHGWHLGLDRDGGWSGCRIEGWLLDRQDVCVSIHTEQGRVTVLLGSSDSW